MDKTTGNAAAAGDVVPATFTLAADEDIDIDRFGSMPIEEVNAELRKHGISPEETVKAVIALVNEKLHPRRVDHLERLMVFYVMLAVASSIRRQVLCSARLWQIGRAAPVRMLS